MLSGLAPGLKIPGDEAILARAAAEERVLVTLDKDFGELVIVRARVTQASFESLASRHATNPPPAFKSWPYTEFCSKAERDRDCRTETRSRSAGGRGVMRADHTSVLSLPATYCRNR
jgi:hypothetical protein